MPRRLRSIQLILVILGIALGLTACNPTQATSQPSPVVTETPAPIQSPQIEITPEKPKTDTPLPPLEDEKVFDPYVKVETSEINLTIGDSISVTGWPVDIGLPYYYLILRDEGVQDNPYTIIVTYDNQITLGEGRSKVLEWVSAEGQIDQVTFVLRAIAEGVTTLDIEAAGELQLQDGSTRSVGGSGTVLIIVGD